MVMVVVVVIVVVTYESKFLVTFSSYLYLSVRWYQVIWQYDWEIIYKCDIISVYFSNSKFGITTPSTKCIIIYHKIASQHPEKVQLFGDKMQ